MCLGARIHRAANLRDPEGNAVMHEYRKRKAELIAVKGALRFPYHHGMETPVGIFQSSQETRSLGPTSPGN